MALAQREMMQGMQEQNSEKLDLLELRLLAGFVTQTQFAQGSGVGLSTANQAENSYKTGYVISKRSATLMVNALKKKGVTEVDGIKVKLETINWYYEV